MKTCDIVRDLIPLYIDGEASAESEALVGEHLNSCEKCKEYYATCKRVTHPSLGIVGKKRYRYSALVKKIELERLKEAAAVAVIASTLAGMAVYACTKGKR